jgi:hypothetical protein
MYEAKCRIKDLQRTLTGEYVLSLTVPSSVTTAYDELKEKDLRVELKEWREKRSLDANAYFHVLVGKIAEKVGISAEQCKINMVLDYGTIARDEDGFKVGMMVNKGADINKMYKYAKPIGTRTVNGTEVDCYMVYEHTSLYDSAQMANLINGVIQEAQELGIETMTPAEQAKILSLWGSKNA